MTLAHQITYGLRNATYWPEGEPGNASGALDQIADWKVERPADDSIVSGEVPRFTDSTGRVLTGSGIVGDSSGNLTTSGDLAVSGDLLVSGSVNGRSTAADGAKLDSIVGQILKFTWGSTSAGSGNIFLLSSRANQMSGGVGAYQQQGAPQDMSLVRVEVRYEVTSYTSGAPSVALYVNNTTPVEYEQALATPSGTGNRKDLFDVAAGANEWAEGDDIVCRFDAGHSGASMTVDDITVAAYFILDDRWAPS